MCRRLLVKEGEDVRRIGGFFGREEFGVEDGTWRKKGERKKGGGGEKEERTVLTGGQEKVLLEGQRLDGCAVHGGCVELLSSRWREASTL